MITVKLNLKQMTIDILDHDIEDLELFNYIKVLLLRKFNSIDISKKDIAYTEILNLINLPVKSNLAKITLNEVKNGIMIINYEPIHHM